MTSERQSWPSNLEIGRVCPGEYLAEGHAVSRVERRNDRTRPVRWRIDDGPAVYFTLAEALWEIAYEIAAT